MIYRLLLCTNIGNVFETKRIFHVESSEKLFQDIIFAYVFIVIIVIFWKFIFHKVVE